MFSEAPVLLRVLIVAGLLLALSPAFASVLLDFEGLPDGTDLTTQIPTATFSNALILTAGIGLNEFEFPPHSGVNVVSDSGGPISVAFSTPVQDVIGYFTYTTQLTLTAFNPANLVVATAVSAFNNNVACLAGPPCSGDLGSVPDESIGVAAFAGISRLLIAGDPLGGSFVLDDLSFSSSPVPEPGTIPLVISGVVVFLCVRREHSV